VSDFAARAEAKVRALWKERSGPMPLRAGRTAPEVLPVLRWLAGVLAADPGLFAAPVVGEIIGRAAGFAVAFEWTSEGEAGREWSVSTSRPESLALVAALRGIGRVLSELRPPEQRFETLDAIARDEARRPPGRKIGAVRDDLAAMIGMKGEGVRPKGKATKRAETFARLARKARKPTKT
jgi:hypothetical protein